MTIAILNGFESITAALLANLHIGQGASYAHPRTAPTAPMIAQETMLLRSEEGITGTAVKPWV